LKVAVLGLAAAVLFAAAPPPSAAQEKLRPEVASFIDEMVKKHRFERAALARLFAQAQPRPSVIRAMSAPGTARPWHEFRAMLIDETRVSGGIEFWRRHADTLARASREYGVPEEIIVATIGIETLYGRNTGSFRVLEALIMLAFDYPRRAELFRGELEEFLLLAREAKLDALKVRGSYAGAMGIPQFLPSSYRKYAVDFNGDGSRDLWQEDDAIGSVANYYRAFGWRAGEQIAVRANGGGEAEAVIAAGFEPHMTVAQMRKRGVVPLAPVPDDALAMLYTVDAGSGPEHWIGLQNFYVITRYNRSVNYAMAVRELARELRGRMDAAGAR
jgi:membrane-bound lytic murein transglycosylase B